MSLLLLLLFVVVVVVVVVMEIVMTVLLSALQRSITTQCDKSTEGNSHYNSSQTDMVWICRGGGGGKWIPYR